MKTVINKLLLNKMRFITVWAEPKTICTAEMSTDQDWSQFWPDQDWMGLQLFWKLVDQDCIRLRKFLLS